jgi:protein-tyrosine phosphatase
MTSPDSPGTPGRSVPRRIRGILRQIRAWGENRPDVEAVLLYGSVPRGTADHFSDIDLIVVRSSDVTTEEIVKSLKSELDVPFFLDKDGKSVFFLRSSTTKVELSVTDPTGLPEFGAYFEGSRIVDLAEVFLVVKDPGLRSSAEALLRPSQKAQQSDDIAREATSFLYYYEAFHAAFHRGDHFRAYFLYSLAFYKLGSFLAASGGKRESLYAPERLVEFLESVQPSLREKFETCAPVWGHDLTPLLLKKELMFELFESSLLASATRLPFLLESARAMKQFVRERYPPLWRWRDLGGKGKLAPGRVFRASRLDRYPADVLVPFLKTEGIRTVVDLRTDVELGRHSYPPVALEGVRYVRIPVWPTLPVPEKVSEQERLNFFYGHVTEDPGFPLWMKSLLSEISRPENLPLVMHCHAGADRTGILVAILLSLAGASDEEIIEDYLITSGHVRREYIEALQERLGRMGGARAALESKGVPAELIEASLSALTVPEQYFDVGRRPSAESS